VPPWRAIWNCSPPNCFFHSASVFSIFSTSTTPVRTPAPSNSTIFTVFLITPPNASAVGPPAAGTDIKIMLIRNIFCADGNGPTGKVSRYTGRPDLFYTGFLDGLRRDQVQRPCPAGSDKAGQRSAIEQYLVVSFTQTEDIQGGQRSCANPMLNDNAIQSLQYLRSILIRPGLDGLRSKPCNG
jgi:hypothetical protein